MAYDPEDLPGVDDDPLSLDALLEKWIHLVTETDYVDVAAKLLLNSIPEVDQGKGVGGIVVTCMSTSLWSRTSPRATEPNTPRDTIPYWSA